MGISLRGRLVGTGLLLALVAGAAGCARSDFEDRTAVVSVGGSRQTYAVDACGLDEHTAFVVARADDGAIVQAVLGLDDDDQTGVPASTGITVDLDPTSTDTRVAAFGPEAWERRGSAGTAPGSIASARLRGSRIQFSGTAAPVDAADVPEANGEARSFSFDARCDQVDE